MNGDNVKMWFGIVLIIISIGMVALAIMIFRWLCMIPDVLKEHHEEMMKSYSDRTKPKP